MLKIWTLIFSILFCSYLYADDSIVVELGSASGDTTWKDTGVYSSLIGKIIMTRQGVVLVSVIKKS